jgi:hypothetical protein
MEKSTAPPSFPPPSPTLKPYGSRLALGYWWAHSLIIHMFKRSVAAPGALRRAQCARASSARERGSTVSITSKRALGSTDFFLRISVSVIPLSILRALPAPFSWASDFVKPTLADTTLTHDPV